MGKVIGLFGLTFGSGNLGCQALAYSFCNILNQYERIEKVYLFFEGNTEQNNIQSARMIPMNYSFKNSSSLKVMIQKMKKCDVIFDFTEGDSFSDIYGLKRFFHISLSKIIAIHYSKVFILGPQTYGPYNTIIAKIVSKYIFKKSTYIFSRDDMSRPFVERLSKRKVGVFTDVAFSLPYQKSKMTETNRVGINVSGLLWNGGYTGENQFDLKVDYKEYIMKIITRLSEMGYEIHLIPHVITKCYESVENDFATNNEIAKIFPYVKLAPAFKNPIEAKNYISTMNVFIGARMHATIASFSSCVTTIPFSYSKKFEGLFGSVDYPYVILARELSTDVAVEKTIEFVKNANQLTKAQNDSMKQINIKLEEFNNKLDEIIGD